MQACMIARVGEDVGARKCSLIGGSGSRPSPWPGRWTDAERGRYRPLMKTGADVITLAPRWMASAGALLKMNALVRSRCVKCGTLLRVELEDIVARHGPGWSLVDRLDRCRMIGCAGSTFYLASRTYGREWTTLVRDPELLASLDALPPASTALG